MRVNLCYNSIFFRTFPCISHLGTLAAFIRCTVLQVSNAGTGREPEEARRHRSKQMKSVLPSWSAPSAPGFLPSKASFAWWTDGYCGQWDEGHSYTSWAKGASAGLNLFCGRTYIPASQSWAVIIWSESLGILLFPYDDSSLHCAWKY